MAPLSYIGSIHRCLQCNTIHNISYSRLQDTIQLHNYNTIYEVQYTITILVHNNIVEEARAFVLRLHYTTARRDDTRKKQINKQTKHIEENKQNRKKQSKTSKQASYNDGTNCYSSNNNKRRKQRREGEADARYEYKYEFSHLLGAQPQPLSTAAAAATTRTSSQAFCCKDKDSSGTATIPIHQF